jgi:transposase
MEENRQLRRRVEELEREVQELKGRLSKTSQTSHKPPSSDGPQRPKTKSSRESSGRKPGGQVGHQGSTLKKSETPDKVVEHLVKRCEQCSADLSGAEGKSVEGRQVFEIPHIRLEVTEHRIEEKECACCGHMNRSRFPKDVVEVVSYGNRVRALAIYLMNQQLIPYDRAAQLFSDLFGQGISKGTLHEIQKECAEALEFVVETHIKTMAIKAELAHFDETGVRCEGKNHWLHVAAGLIFTYYAVHSKRGRKAIEAIGILPSFCGIAVHDCWGPYFHYKQCRHSLCNAHIVRELTFVHEQEKEPWAGKMKKLLYDIHKKVKRWKSKRRTHLGAGTLESFQQQYDRLINSGLRLHEKKAQLVVQARAKRGRKKQLPGKNLLDRLKEYQDYVLAFVYDFAVPFTNNQAEQDIRMQKVKNKISGCFRTLLGAQRFCRIRSYISTARKQGWNILAALESAMAGAPMLPAFSPKG